MLRTSALPTLAVLLGTLLLPAASAAPSGDWAWPVAEAREILRPYEAPRTRYAAGHRGIDIRATGTVHAPEHGVVHFVGYVVNRPVVSIAHDRGLLSSFEPVMSTLAAGDVVRRGQQIGTLAEYAGGADDGSAHDAAADTAPAGHCSPGCLHVGVRHNGEYLSPLALFGDIPAAVLLPPRQDTSSANGGADGRLSPDPAVPRSGCPLTHPLRTPALPVRLPQARGCANR
jgi:murein DD-endopeptidase MepM/ murein hydrolase activator NlpD